MILQIWDILVKSNTFNFIVMLVILYIVIKKFSIKTSLENLRNKVITNIENAKEENSNAGIELKNTEKSVENLPQELAIKIENAEKQAQTLADNILKQTESKIKQIETNVQKNINAEEKTISTVLTQKAAKSSSELAKEHIKSVLKNHPEMHEKFINQSIEELG